MPYLALHSIHTASIPRHTGVSDPRLKDFRGDEMYEAYLGNLAAAEALAGHSPSLYQDAWISLHLSVECFFKHVYYLLLSEFEKHSRQVKRALIGPIEYDAGFLFYHQAYATQSKISEKSLGHEVLQLWNLFDRFTDAHHNVDFQTLRQHILPAATWVNRRYERRNHARLKSEYESYLNIFQKTLDSLFGALK